MRKLLLSLLIACIFHSSVAQELFRLNNDSLVVLDTGWKYTMGDDPVYASPKFNDRGWKPIRADLDIHNSLPADADSGIGWMRLRISVSEKLRGTNLALGT